MPFNFDCLDQTPPYFPIHTSYAWDATDRRL